MKTKQYKVTMKNGWGVLQDYYYYAINERHAIHCHLASHPYDMGRDAIEEVSEHGPHPAFQFKEPPTQEKEK